MSVIPARSSWCTPFPNDEPVERDELKRGPLAEELARISLCCDTPMVIGLYGGWGSGKTSLMRMVHKALCQTTGEDKGRLQDFVCIPNGDEPCKKGSPAAPFIVNFNPWAFQFADNPALCLVQALVSSYEENLSCPEKAKLKNAVLSLIKSATVKFKLPLAIEAELDLNKYAETVQKGLDAQVKQSEHYATVIKKILECYDRIIFLIDDVDRCLPEQALRLLEAIKLYLNQQGCVYFLAVDNNQLEKGIEQHLGRSLVTINGSSYLDKIVQLPFTLPGIDEGAKEKYITNYLKCIPDYKRLVKLVCAGIDDVPRKMKRFLIDLRMNHLIGMRHKGYNVHMAAFVLFIQWRAAALYEKISNDGALLLKMTAYTEEGVNLRAQLVDNDERLKKVFEIAMHDADVPRDEDEVKKYVRLSRFVIDKDAITLRDDFKEFEAAIEPHREWLSSGGQRGKKADLLRRQCPGYNNPDYEDKEPNDSSDRKKKMERRLLKIDLSRANLFGIFMEGADLSGCTFYETNMEEAALSAIIFAKSDLTRVNLKGADLKDACFEDAILVEAQLWLTDLSGSNLQGAQLTRAYLYDADLEEANLRFATLCGANLTRTKLHKASLDEASFSKANLCMANLVGVRARKTSFEGAYLKGALLSSDKEQSDFQNADFTNAVLTNADLRGVDCRGANIKNATLEGADLTNADFTGAIHLDDVQLSAAKFTRITMPDGTIRTK